MCVTNQANCVTVSFQFPTMSVTYQVNYHVKFSEYVCDISGKLYHCIIPFSDNVCDISGQQHCQRKKMYHPIFWQCLWHTRPTKLSKKKNGGKKKRENNGGNSDKYDVASQLPNSNRLQRRCLCLFSYIGRVDCVQIIFLISYWSYT